MKKKTETTRRFGGKIDNFKDKEERAFEKKHLKAYLSGKKFFKNGIDPDSKRPVLFEVKEILI